MKTKILRKIVLARRWANTKNGEKIIVGTLSAMFFILLADSALLILGMIL